MLLLSILLIFANNYPSCQVMDTDILRHSTLGLENGNLIANFISHKNFLLNLSFLCESFPAAKPKAIRQGSKQIVHVW